MTAAMPSPPAAPTPPPLPPALKQRSLVPTPPTVAPSAINTISRPVSSYQDAMVREEKLESAHARKPFSPCFFFFYGSLMDPEVLQAVLGLPEPPTAEKASVTGFSMKMWGIYPTLTRSDPGKKISGTAWKVESEAHFLRLSAYETEAYTWCACDIELDNGDMLRGCRTFCWAGDPDSKDLEEGIFDLQRYQRHFKQSIVRKRASQDEAST